MQSNCLSAIAEVLPRLSHDRLSQLITTPPLPQCTVCVIVPVRNEADTLESTLAALADQIDLQGQALDPAAYEVIVLANNCTDDSAAIARQFAASHPTFALHVAEVTLPPSEAYIGRVRRLLMDEAYNRLMALDRSQGIIASTDGDTCVAPNWIAAIREEIRQGADAVSGRLLTVRRDRALLDSYTRLCYLRAVGYGYLSVELEAYIDPDPFDCLPRHHQHGGASLAVTAEMYAIAGGLPPVRTPEDVAFYQALKRVGARFRHSSRVQVFTSMRQQGRTDNGMANQLSVWTDLGRQQQPYLVESAAALETRLTARSRLRELWNRSSDRNHPCALDVKSIAHQLQISAHGLTELMRQAQSFAELFERVEQRQLQEGRWQQVWQPVEIEQAIADLRLRISALRQNQRSYPKFPSFSPAKLPQLQTNLSDIVVFSGL